LTIGCFTYRAAILSLNADRIFSLLKKTGVINIPATFFIAQLSMNGVFEPLSELFMVPFGRAQETLKRLWVVKPCRFCKCPTGGKSSEPEGI